MPEAQVRQEFAKLAIVSTDQAVNLMAFRFEVSAAASASRLLMPGLLPGI